ncbi:MAG: hypothetical protein M1828_002813 [Chrysothrix sp. TS-e1954]|nr:MAG: hypothetical protein M1828_002813 [Chrysothrix sp. TS-e1954]
MATEAPDARSFKTWQDAFQYPIPTVRGMEKKLRNNLNENHDKLRTLVGGSYRDLLGTAQTIIDINDQMRDVEQLLADASRKSDSRVLDKVADQRAKLQQHHVTEEQDRLALASQLSTLKSSLAFISKLLRTNGSILLAAKLLIVARLLHKTLVSRSNAPAACSNLGSKLGLLRQKLLRHIDRRVARHDVGPAELVQVMSAFSLATSSVPSATFSHFLHLRSEAISKAVSGNVNDVQRIIERRIELFVGTLRLAKTVFPDLLAPSLRTLGAGPVLSDSSVTAIEDLNLDIHTRWFSDEDRNFIPWSRHDELKKSKAIQMTRTWSAGTLQSLVAQMSSDLSNESDFPRLAETRHAVLQMWLSSRRYAYGLSAREALSALRSPFVGRQKSLVEETVERLRNSLQFDVVQAINDWDKESEDNRTFSLWDHSMKEVSIQDGAAPFKREIVNRRHGRGVQIQSLISTYDTHAKSVQDIHVTLKNMRDAKWDDDYDDDSESSGSETGNDHDDNSVWQSLSRSDPEDLQTTLRERLQSAILGLQDGLTSHLQSNMPDCSSHDSPGIYLLRALRELRQRLPRLLLEIDPKTRQSLFCDDLADSLHLSLAQHIQASISESFQGTLNTSATGLFHIRALWDGTPQLPVQPSPATFRYLRTTNKEMERLGQDLWTSGAVTKVKELAAGSAVEAIERTATTMIDRARDMNHDARHVIEETGSGDDGNKAQTNGDQANDGPADGDQGNGGSADGDQGNEDSADGDQATQSSDEKDNVSPSSNEPKEARKNSITKDDTQQTHTDRLIQLHFDTLYLCHAFSPASNHFDKELEPPAALQPILERLASQTDSDEASKAKLRKNALEYWKKTYLLFGLLSSF